MAGNPSKSDFRGQWAAEVDPTPPATYWHDRFYEGGINVVAGPSGVMKSTFVARVVADVSRYVGPVLYSNLEDAKSIQRARLEASGADMDKVRILMDAPYYIPQDLRQLEADVLAGGFKVLVMDTAAKHIDAPLTKSTDKTARVLVPLSQVCERTGLSIILIEHTLKHTKGFANGLAAIPDGLSRTARMGILFGYDPQDSDLRAAAVVKDSYRDPLPGMTLSIEVEPLSEDDADSDEVDADGNPVAKRGIATLHVDSTNVDIADPLSLVRIHAAKGETDSNAKKAEAAKFLTEALANGPVPVNDCELCPQHGHVRAKDGGCPMQGCTATALTGFTGLTGLADEAGIAWRTVRRAKDAIGIEIGKKSGQGKGGLAYWRLPAGHPKLAKNAPTTL